MPTSDQIAAKIHILSNMGATRSLLERLKTVGGLALLIERPGSFVVSKEETRGDLMSKRSP